MPTYNGHKNWNHWNVSLWINNDEALYRMALNLVRRKKNRDAAAREMVAVLRAAGTHKTLDGAPYSVSSVKAAMKEK